MVGAGEHLALLGQRPAVEVAPRLQEPQHAVEAPGQRVGAGPDLARAGRRALARGPLAPGRGRGRGARVGAAVDRVRLDGGRLVGDRPAARRRRRRPRGAGGSMRARRSASPTSCWKARLFGGNGRGSSMRPSRSGGRAGRRRRASPARPFVSTLFSRRSPPLRYATESTASRCRRGRPRRRAQPGQGDGDRDRARPRVGALAARSRLHERPVLRDVAALARARRCSSVASRSCWRSSRASSRTTAWSAWYCANDRFSRWWASGGS